MQRVSIEWIAATMVTKRKNNIPESVRRAPQKWRIRYSKDWECTFWCSFSSSLTVCRSASELSWRKDLWNRRGRKLISVTKERPLWWLIKRSTHRKVHRRPFSLDSWLQGQRQLVFRPSGRSGERSKCRPTCFPAFPGRAQEISKETRVNIDISTQYFRDQKYILETTERERARERERERERGERLRLETGWVRDCD